MSDEEDFMEVLSDEGGALSSSEEEEELRRNLDAFIEKSVRKGTKTTSDFEEDMQAELDKRCADYQKAEPRNVEIDAEGSTVTGPNGQKFYSEIYYDTDSEDEDKTDNQADSKKFSEERHVLSNDDLLYNPNMDEEDQSWIDKQRRRYQPKSAKGEGPKKLPNSDAVLNCPACFSLLCLDCQRHEVYRTQYRAMFVMNCTIDETQLLHMQQKDLAKPNGKKFKKNGKTGTQESNSSAEREVDEASSETGKFSQNGVFLTQKIDSEATGDSYYPVKCSECGTEVAVYDQEEVYHFFNVLSSF